MLVIAERAGVSVGTVDRVLHDRPNVSKPAREKVEQALKEMNYQPNMRTFLVDNEPRNEPQQTQRTNTDKGYLPAETDKQHQDEYRSKDATYRCCRTEKSLCKGSLLLWEPFRIALCSARPRSCLAQSEHHSESRQRELAS